MKTCVELTLAILLLAIPLVIFLIFNLPGLGALAAFALLIGYMVHRQHDSAPKVRSVRKAA